MTKTDAQAYLDRWTAVRAVEMEELRSTSVFIKFQQLAALMAVAGAFDWSGRVAEDDVVRERWNRLRRHCGV